MIWALFFAEKAISEQKNTLCLEVRLLRPKMMPKQLLNNSKPTFKKSKKRLFWPPKWSNHGYQFWKNGQNFTKKSRFWWSPNNILGRYYTQVWALWVQKQCPNNFKTTSKQLWKKSKFDPKYASVHHHHHHHPPPPPTK